MNGPAEEMLCQAPETHCWGDHASAADLCAKVPDARPDNAADSVERPAQLADFHGTAAAGAQLGIGLSVDTTVARLAGTLGLPVRTLLAYAADWRWFFGRADRPWYPTMRLYRQRQRGIRVDAFQQLARDLAGFLAPRGGGNR